MEDPMNRPTPPRESVPWTEAPPRSLGLQDIRLQAEDASHLALQVVALALAAFAAGLLIGAILFRPHPVHAEQAPAEFFIADPVLIAWTPRQIDLHIDRAAGLEQCGCADELKFIAERESNYREIGFQAVTKQNTSTGAWSLFQFIPAGGVWDDTPIGQGKALYRATVDEQMDMAAWALAHGLGRAWALP
jgi:hypothetical protein